MEGLPAPYNNGMLFVGEDSQIHGLHILLTLMGETLDLYLDTVVKNSNVGCKSLILMVFSSKKL